MNYYRNKELAKTVNTLPTRTEQSGADQTNINIIVRSHMITGQAPGGKQPIYEDFSQLPTDLREMIETTRGVARLRESLPQGLKEKPLEELLALRPDEIANILKPAQTPAPKEEKPEAK